MPKIKLRRNVVIATASLSIAGLALTGCSGSTGSAGSSEFTVLSVNENTTVATTLETLAQDECKAENTAMPLKIDSVPQNQLEQQVQLLAGQDALPDIFAIGNNLLLKDLHDSGQAIDLTTVLDDPENITPAATGTINTLFGALIELPTEYNIDGIWYNKQLFADNSIELPTTWDELVTAAATLSDAGVQPFSASGQQGWPLTRLISGYAFREVGPDALSDVANGDAKLTDPAYVEAATAVADLGAQGWFGQGVGSVTYDVAMNNFLSGQSAMLYMGTWALSNFNDTEQNQIGVENIGYMPFPDVDGGAGSIDQVPAGVGLNFAASKNLASDDAKAWLNCIAANYGTVALRDSNQITGFRVNDEVEVSALTADAQKVIAGIDTSVTWWEEPFSAEFQTTAQNNAAPLVSGTITPDDYMSELQTIVDNTN